MHTMTKLTFYWGGYQVSDAINVYCQNCFFQVIPATLDNQDRQGSSVITVNYILLLIVSALVYTTSKLKVDKVEPIAS